MFRRSAFRLCQQASKESVRPGHKDATALDWVQTFVNPFYHAGRLASIQEQVDSTKSRKWIIVCSVLYVSPPPPTTTQQPNPPPTTARTRSTSSCTLSGMV